MSAILEKARQEKKWAFWKSPQSVLLRGPDLKGGLIKKSWNLAIGTQRQKKIVLHSLSFCDLHDGGVGWGGGLWLIFKFQTLKKKISRVKLENNPLKSFSSTNMNRIIFSSLYYNPDWPSCLVHLIHCIYTIFHFSFFIVYYYFIFILLVLNRHICRQWINTVF